MWIYLDNCDEKGGVKQMNEKKERSKEKCIKKRTRVLWIWIKISFMLTFALLPISKERTKIKLVEKER